MKNYYSALGLNKAATSEEIRRAYRVLARRYHPDVNPGAESTDRFKLISEAYKTLQDTARRKDYDLKLEQHERKLAEQKLKTYSTHFKKRMQSVKSSSVYTDNTSQKKNNSLKKISENSFVSTIKDFFSKGFLKLERKRKELTSNARELSIIEVSLTIEDALLGVKKTIEVQEPAGMRKISVKIPPGVRTGSVVRMRNRFQLREEIVLIIQVAQHPFLRLEKKGLIVELPVTPSEALRGANVTVPTLSDQIVIKVPEGSQSGSYIRVKGRGITGRDGTQGDLYFQVMVRLPEDSSSPDLLQLSKHIENYYAHPVRSKLPKRLLEHQERKGK